MTRERLAEMALEFHMQPEWNCMVCDKDGKACDDCKLWVDALTSLLERVAEEARDEQSALVGKLRGLNHEAADVIECQSEKWQAAVRHEVSLAKAEQREADARLMEEYMGPLTPQSIANAIREAK